MEFIKTPDEKICEILSVSDGTAKLLYESGEIGYWPEESLLQLSAVDVIQVFEKVLDNHIDAVAQAKGYDSRLTCALRAGYVNVWQSEGIAFGQWMDACYEQAFQMMNDYLAEAPGAPTTKAEFSAALPVMVWPE